MRNLASLLAGLTFGFGLALSGMTHPEKVLNFLDVTGTWDASLLFVLGGAVGVTLITFRFILRQKKPLFDERFFITEENKIDKPLMLGATLFGIGWGISGYCPGPVIALIAAPNWELWAFLPAAIAGALVEKRLERRAQASHSQTPPADTPSEGSCG
ncbi:MAG: YeeE/YedE family protein [Gallionella sp.]|jgi:hypothetical protein